MEDGSSFFLSVDFFLQHGIRKGLTLSPDQLEEVKSESLFVEAYTKADSLLLRQLYTRYKLKLKLQSKGYDNGAIERALDYLESQGRIDDERFAEKWVESRLRNKLDSYNSLYAGLMNKGIAGQIAKKLLNQLYTDDVEEFTIVKSIEKLKKQGIAIDVIKRRLIQKGFNRKLILINIEKEGDNDNSY